MKKLLTLAILGLGISILAGCSMFSKEGSKITMDTDSGAVEMLIEMDEEVIPKILEKVEAVKNEEVEEEKSAEEKAHEEHIAAIDQENRDKDLLYTYYKALTEKDFSTAASIHEEKTEEGLASTYSKIRIAIPYGLKSLGDRTYSFDVYYVDRGQHESTTYEVVKGIQDGKLYSISAKEKEWISPGEFNIDGTGNYIVFKEGEQKVKDFFGSEDRAKYRAQESLNYRENINTEQQAELEAKAEYFQNFLAQYSDEDLVQEYRIVDKNFIDAEEYLYDGHPDARDRGEWISSDGLSIYVIENKGIYSVDDENFFADFKTSSGIPDIRPLKVGEKYFVIENFMYCGASACPFQADEIRKMIKSENFILH